MSVTISWDVLWDVFESLLDILGELHTLPTTINLCLMSEVLFFDKELILRDNRKALKNLSLVCKAWEDSGLNALWNEITVLNFFKFLGPYSDNPSGTGQQVRPRFFL